MTLPCAPATACLVNLSITITCSMIGVLLFWLKQVGGSVGEGSGTGSREMTVVVLEQVMLTVVTWEKKPPASMCSWTELGATT